MSRAESGLRLVWNAEQRRAPQAEAAEGTRIGTTDGLRGPEVVRIPFAHLCRGLYISGKPRTGKSTAMLNLILDDFRRGRAGCVIDPHGELITAVLERLPLATNQDVERVVVFDPTNLDWPIGIDLLDATNQFEQDRAIQFMIELIERMVPIFARGPILEQGVRNSMRLLMEAGGRLTDIPELLTNKSFCRSKLRHVRDPLLRRYWEHIWTDLLKSNDGPGYAAYFTSKFSQFLDDRTLRNIFGQRGGLNFRAAIDAGQLLLFDLGRGRLGTVNSQILGLVILHCIERAVMRTPVSAAGCAVYVDEVHEFDVENLCRMVTAFPKQHAALVLANQTLADLSGELRSTVLGSIGTFLFLRQGAEVAVTLEELTQPRFDARDLMNLPDHHAIFRTDALGARRACRVALTAPGKPVSDEDMVTQLRRYAACKIGRRREEVEAEILASLGDEED